MSWLSAAYKRSKSKFTGRYLVAKMKPSTGVIAATALIPVIGPAVAGGLGAARVGMGYAQTAIQKADEVNAAKKKAKALISSATPKPTKNILGGNADGRTNSGWGGGNGGSGGFISREELGNRQTFEPEYLQSAQFGFGDSFEFDW